MASRRSLNPGDSMETRNRIIPVATGFGVPLRLPEIPLDGLFFHAGTPGLRMDRFEGDPPGGMDGGSRPPSQPDAARVERAQSSRGAGRERATSTVSHGERNSIVPGRRYLEDYSLDGHDLGHAGPGRPRHLAVGRQPQIASGTRGRVEWGTVPALVGSPRALAGGVGRFLPAGCSHYLGKLISTGTPAGQVNQCLLPG